ncbi:hypothetical protein LZL87_009129 [Fusarium oxysporum]|nr:hypothetical protein LZL87_009129 [Fusarium oxysporum]
MVSPTATCLSCGKQGRLLDCAACHDAQYCSTDWQRSDWKVHSLMCKRLKNYSADLKPSTRHFRVIVFPHEVSQPEFAWAFADDKAQLLINHPLIKAWKTRMEGRYGVADDDPLIVHALSRDRAIVVLFIVDPFLPGGYSNPHLTVCNVIGTHNPVTEVNIAAKINGKYKWYSPRPTWRGARGAFPKSSGSMLYARFLNHGIMLGYKGIFVGQFTMGDGILVYDAFCKKIHRLYLRKKKNQHEDNQHISFADAPSPYNDIDNDKPMLFQFASTKYKSLGELLQDREFLAIYMFFLYVGLFMKDIYDTRCDLLPNFCTGDMNKKWVDENSVEYTIEEDKQQREQDMVTTAPTSDGVDLDLAALAAASLNIMQK